MRTLLIVVLILSTMAAITLPAHAKTVNLVWEASPTPDVKGYKVYQSATADMATPVATDAGPALILQIIDLPDNEGQYYAVKAYNAVDQESVYSNVVYSPAFAPPEPSPALGGTTVINNIEVPVQ